MNARAAPNALWALFLLAALTPSHAEEVPFGVTGTVSQVLPTNQPTADALAAAGVFVGAAATVDFTVESTTPVNEGETEFSFYTGALTSLTGSIGTYTIQKNIPFGFESLNFVQVGDDEPGGLPVADSWTLTTPSLDGGVLHTISQTSFATTTLQFFDNSGGAGTDEGVIQDPAGYQFATAVFGGANGTVLVTLDIGNGGGGGGPVVGPGLCARGQLQAAAKLTKSAFKCHAKRAQQPPEKDPKGQKLAACLDKAAEKFAKQFAAAVAKAAKKGGPCLLAGTESQNASDQLTEHVEVLTEGLLIGADTAEKLDRVLRGKLLKASAAQAGKDLAAHGKDAFKPNAGKLALKLAKSRAATLKKAQKAIDAATNKGVIYAGPTAEEIADGISALVDSFVLLTEGVVTNAGDAPSP